MSSKKVFILILVILIVLFGGWQLYKIKKENDRQAIIHMGDDLKRASDEYNKRVSDIDDNLSLAREYTALMDSILSGKVIDNASKKKACELEKELMRLYPHIYDEPSSICR